MVEPSDENPWKKGMEVEVMSVEERYTATWLEASIIIPPPPSSLTCKNSNEIKSSIALVKYKTLAQASARKKKRPLLEFVDASCLRPVPPKDESNRSEKYAFSVNDDVDAYHLDGWCVGVVTTVLIPSSGSCDKYRYIVDFENLPDKLELDSSNLRLHLDWVDGQWIKHAKKTHVFEIATVSDSGTPKDNTKCSQIDTTTLSNHVFTDKNFNQTTGSSDSINSHPSKRLKKGDTPEYNGKEKIEITPQQTGVVSQTVDTIEEKERPPAGFIQHSPASVERMQTNALGDTTPPGFKSKKSIKNPSHCEYTRQMPKDCGHIIQTKRSGTPPKILVACQKSNTTDTVATKCKSGAVQHPKSTYGIDQQKEWGTTGQTKRGGRIPKLLIKRKKYFDGSGCTFNGVQVPTGTRVNSNGSRDASIGNIDGASREAHKMESDSMAITKIYEQPLRVLCSEGGILNQLNSVKETHTELSQHNRELPFTKRCSVWDMFESMKEFEMVKHFPHFNDLLNFEERCREGLAIGKLVIFKNLVNERPNLKLDDPQCLWDNYWKVLLDLEMNGFDVQELKVCFEDMLVIKDTQQRNQDELKKHEIRLLEEENKKRKIEEELGQLNEEFIKIQEKRAAAISIKEIQDFKAATSQLAANDMLEVIRNTQLEFERLIGTTC